MKKDLWKERERRRLFEKEEEVKEDGETQARLNRGSGPRTFGGVELTQLRFT